MLYKHLQVRMLERFFLGGGGGGEWCITIFKSLCSDIINKFFCIFFFCNFLLYFCILLSLCDLCVVLHSSSCCGSVCLLLFLLEVVSKVGILKMSLCGNPHLVITRGRASIVLALVYLNNNRNKSSPASIIPLCISYRCKACRDRNGRSSHRLRSCYSYASTSISVCGANWPWPLSIHTSHTNGCLVL